MPGTSAATQSSRCGKSPNEPSRVSAAMLDTSVLSAKIWNGRRTLRCMRAGGMFDFRLRFRLGLRMRLGRGFGRRLGGGLQLGLGFGFRTGLRLWLRFECKVSDFEGHLGRSVSWKNADEGGVSLPIGFRYPRSVSFEKNGVSGPGGDALSAGVNDFAEASCAAGDGEVGFRILENDGRG